MDSPCACETESLPTEPKQNGESHSEELDHPELVSRVEEIAAEAPKITEQPAKKSEVKPAKSNKKLKEEEKKLKLLFRNFEGLETPEAKMDALGRKHIQLMSEHKMTGARKEDLETRIEKVMKERDQLQSDFNKASLARSKLESLCRELQRHSKLVKEECQLRAQEEEAKRKELSEKFQTTINDISEQMQENSKANQQLKTENNDLVTRLKGLVEQYEVREEHVEKVFKHKQLELQLAEAKMAQQHLQFNEDKEKTLTEKQLLLKQAQEYKKQCEILTKQEKEMKKQLAMYAERFEDFQKTLNKSNEVFGTFKKEMDKMTKTIKKLEKEKSTWKTKCENGNRSLLQMVDEREKHRTEISGLKTKNEKLENLCRALHKAGAKELEKALDKAEQAAAALPSERATVPCVTATALQDVTTECEDTRSHESEQRPVVAEGEESNVDVVEEEEANGDNMNANEIEALEEKLEEFANSFSSDRIQESSDENSQEAADVGTSPTESGESPTDSEESPSTPEETSESPEEVPNESGKSSIEKKEEAADVGTSTESGESPTNGEEWPNKSEETPESSEEAPNDPTESDKASVITTDKDEARAPDEESS